MHNKTMENLINRLIQIKHLTQKLYKNNFKKRKRKKKHNMLYIIKSNKMARRNYKRNVDNNVSEVSTFYIRHIRKALMQSKNEDSRQ